MKKAGKKKAKKRVTIKKRLTTKKTAPKKAEVKTKVGGKKAAGGKTKGALRNRFGRKAKAWTPWHSRRSDRERGREGNREIYRDCPTSKVRIQRVWTSCSKKETRSRPTW